MTPCGRGYSERAGAARWPKKLGGEIVTQERQQNATWANVGERVADLCIEATAVCGAIVASDLADTPLYIVPLSRVGGVLGGPAECFGFTSPSLDLYLRNDIGDSWRGRGACMAINDLRYTADLDPKYVDLDFFGIVLHELAHIVERPLLFHERQDVEPARLLFESIVMAYYVQEPPPAVASELPLHHHDHRFIRAALHLRHRADAVGMEAAPWLVCPTRDHGLSHWRAYNDALGDEPCLMFETSIRDVLAMPAPEEFSRLWADDLAHLSHHPISPKE